MQALIDNFKLKYMCGDENNKCCGNMCEDCPCQNGEACMRQEDEMLNDELCNDGSCPCCDDDSMDMDMGMYGEGENVNAEIGEPVEDFMVDAYQNGKINKVFLSDYAGKWAILFFYPADFSFVCPTELKELSDMYEKFTAINTEILSVSTDTAFAHKAWVETSSAVKGVKFPMLADPAHEMSEYFDVLMRDDGMARRGTFIINPDGILVSVEINDNSIGRSAKELYRKLQAAQFVYEHGDQVCPASWVPGDDTITPSDELVGKI